jgi:hypothetical protein
LTNQNDKGHALASLFSDILKHGKFYCTNSCDMDQLDRNQIGKYEKVDSNKSENDDEEEGEDDKEGKFDGETECTICTNSFKNHKIGAECGACDNKYC